MHHRLDTTWCPTLGRLGGGELLPPGLQRRNGGGGNTAAANAHTGPAQPLSLPLATYGRGVVPPKGRQQNPCAGRVIMVDHDTITAVHCEMHAVEQSDARATCTRKPCMPLGRGIHERQQWRPVGGMIW
jgi:hypothetical protein